MSSLSSFGRITEIHKKAFKTLGIESARDLLYHFPTRYSDKAELKSIKYVENGSHVTLFGTLSNIKVHPGFGGVPGSVRATLQDASGKVSLIWFNQIYIAKMYPEGSTVKIAGKVTEKSGAFSIVNPDIIKTKNIPIDSSDSLFKKEAEEEILTPIYGETKGITSHYIYTLIRKIVVSDYFKTLQDPIPKEILEKYNLPTLQDALLYIHFPKEEKYIAAARKRFAFEEIFYIQLERVRDRFELEHIEGYIIPENKERLKEFVGQFSFALTSSQKKAVEAIFSDFKKGKPLSRLIEGDVGSGKTAVAAIVSYLTCITRPYIKEKSARQDFGTLQVAYMAPTEILARQHFENFVEYFKGSGLTLALITGSKCLKFPSKGKPGTYTEISKSQLTKWVANGEISMVIGTHALIQKNISFKHLALCIIDEQHRFGVKQRRMLLGKNTSGAVPHLISMTATPIPRTLALTIYGDLDLTLIDQMPLGRKKVITEVIHPGKRDAMYEKVKEELDHSRQVYVICPRIDEADPNKKTSLTVKSVEAEAKRLQSSIFKDYTVGSLHGKMTPQEKDSQMKKFASGEIDILVATSVIEVGVNVPNATTIIIEGSERFGLSQLHQLRGRVIRGTHQPYCYLLSDSANEKTLERLHALVTAKDGFELAELDLHLRGSGGLTAGKQWGVSDIAMEAIKNQKLVEAARESAQNILKKDFNLEGYPLLKEVMAKRERTHLE